MRENFERAIQALSSSSNRESIKPDWRQTSQLLKRRNNGPNSQLPESRGDLQSSRLTPNYRETMPTMPQTQKYSVTAWRGIYQEERVESKCLPQKRPQMWWWKAGNQHVIPLGKKIGAKKGTSVMKENWLWPGRLYATPCPCLWMSVRRRRERSVSQQISCDNFAGATQEYVCLGMKVLFYSLLYSAYASFAVHVTSSSSKSWTS